MTTGAMNDEQVSVLIPASYDTHMGIIRVKHKVARDGVLPSDRGAVGMLGMETTAMADDVVALRGVIEHPIHK